MNKIVILMAAAGAMALGGCMSKINQQWVNSDFKGLSQTNKDIYSKISTLELHLVCEANLKIQKYSDFDQCIDVLKPRLKTEPAGNVAITFSYDSSLAFIYTLEAEKNLELGRYEKSIDFGLAAQKLYFSSLAGNDSTMYKNNMDMLTPGIFCIPAISYALLGKNKAAKDNLDKELERYSKMDKGFGFTGMHKRNEYWIALTMITMKNYKGAYDFLLAEHENDHEKAINSMFSSHSMSDISNLYKALMLNRMALENGKLEQARKGYDILLQDNFVAQLSEVHFRVLQDRAKIALKDNDQKLAEELLLKAIDILESTRAAMQTEGYKLGFAGGRFSIYESMVNLLMNQKRFDEAFAFAERAKSRALVDMLASKQQFGVSNAISNTKSAAEQNKLLAQLDANEAKTRVIGSNEDISTTRKLVRKNQTALYQEAPELSSLVSVKTPDVKEIQKLLPKGETLIEYYGSGHSLFAFVVTGDGVRGVKLEEKGLADDVTAFREAIIKVNSSAYEQSGRKLYDRLIVPLASGIKTKNLTIVPDGALHYLPFSALTSKSDFLIDQYNLRILPSASVLKFLHKNLNDSGSLLVLGNPDLGNTKYSLPYAQKEAIKVSEEVVGSKLLVRNQATESAVKSYGNRFRYLHIASHGFFDAEKPLNSGLLLTKDEQNNGTLTVGELYDLKLNVDLVTLSACETALGKVANGDDVVGFTRGFLYAGASSIVSSLWQVDDAATADLMVGFYANLNKKDKRSALRDAQLATKSRYKHPYYWAAFQITGALQ